MSMFTELRGRLFSGSPREESLDHEGEVLVADSRARLSPSQQVEQKLRGALVNGQYFETELTATRALRPKPR
jgi:hypothetical protein